MLTTQLAARKGRLFRTKSPFGPDLAMYGRRQLFVPLLPLSALIVYFFGGHPGSHFCFSGVICAVAVSVLRFESAGPALRLSLRALSFLSRSVFELLRIPLGAS